MKKKNNRNYFHHETDNAIVKYCECTDTELRNKIYKEEIEHAFFKLTENIIHTFKFYYLEGESIEDLQQEVITFLLTKLHKFNPSKIGKLGKPVKGYSYFGTIAKRYCIIKNKSNYKKLINKGEINNEVEDMFIVHNEGETNILTNEKVNFLDYFIEKVENNINIYPDPDIIGSILDLFKKRESISIINKKAIYLYLRDMTNKSTNIITSNIKVFKQEYKKIFNEWITK